MVFLAETSSGYLATVNSYSDKKKETKERYNIKKSGADAPLLYGLIQEIKIRFINRFIMWLSAFIICTLDAAIQHRFLEFIL